MRYFAFHVERPEEPWVIAEGPDEDWMREIPHNVWYPAVVLSETEAALDPDFAPALSAWRTGNDSAHAAWLSVCDAEGALADATIDLMCEGVIDTPNPPDCNPWGIFMHVPENHPDVECERLFRSIIAMCVKANHDFGEERAVRLWRRTAYYCKDAAERDTHPRLV
jgi:hypothetical protein